LSSTGLAVVSERRVRGAVERTHVLRTSAARLGVDEIAKMSRDEHRQAFLIRRGRPFA
jgi:hypothetical protein